MAPALAAGRTARAATRKSDVVRAKRRANTPTATVATSMATSPSTAGREVTGPTPASLPFCRLGGRPALPLPPLPPLGGRRGGCRLPASHPLPPGGEAGRHLPLEGSSIASPT